MYSFLLIKLRMALGSLCLLALFGCQYQQTSSVDTYKLIWSPNGSSYVYGYLTLQGEVAIYPQYAYAMEFSEGMGGVNVGGTSLGRRMPTNGKWGFINAQGKFVISPKYTLPYFDIGQPFDQEEFSLVQHEGCIFSEGLAAVYEEGKGWKYINTSDSTVIADASIISARRFRSGLANVCRRVNGQARWGYINHAGETVIEPLFLYPANFTGEYAMVVVQVGRTKRRLLIDRNGRQYLRRWILTTPFREFYAGARAYWVGERPNKIRARQMVLVNLEGLPVSEPIYDDVGAYGSGLFPVLFGSKVGNPVTTPQTPGPTEEVGGKWGFVTPTGDIKVPPQFQEAKGFVEGFAPIKKNGFWTYLTTDHIPLTQYEFRWVGPFEDGVAMVRLGPIHNDFDGYFAYLSSNGDILWIEPPPTN